MAALAETVTKIGELLFNPNLLGALQFGEPGSMVGFVLLTAGLPNNAMRLGLMLAVRRRRERGERVRSWKGRFGEGLHNLPDASQLSTEVMSLAEILFRKSRMIVTNVRMSSPSKSSSSSNLRKKRGRGWCKRERHERRWVVRAATRVGRNVP